MMGRNLWHAVRLVDELLDVTRISSNKVILDLQELDLHALLREIVTGIEARFRDRNVGSALFLEAGSDRRRADPSRMRQVFANLLENAINSTPAGRRVEVRSANPRAGRLQVGVHDTGAEIEPQVIGHLFQPFEQATSGYRGGLRLGLAIAKGTGRRAWRQPRGPQ